MEVLPTYMDVEHSRAYIDQLYSNDPQKCFQAVSELKFAVIGSVREKGSIIEQGVVVRLLQILRAQEFDLILKTEVATVLNSLAKGLPEHAAALVQAGLLPVLWEQLEACGGGGGANAYTSMVLCCLRSVYRQGCAPPPPAWDHKLLTTLIQHGYHPPSNQECVANILAHACKTCEQQQQLVEAGGADLVACMLCSPVSRVQLPALHCLAAMCYNNERVSSIIATKSYGGKAVPDLLVGLMARDRPCDMQLAAATALTFLHRAGALSADDPKVIFKTLQCLVRMCRRDREIWERVEAANTLAYLTEVSTELQRTAAMTDHLIHIMNDYLKDTPTADASAPQGISVSPISCRQYDNPSTWPDLMLEAALKVYASLGANDEDIRQRVINTEGLMNTIVGALSAACPPIQLAAVRCLHSLSRSVHTLRTTFQDHMVWRPLMTVLKTSNSEELVTVASSTLCNLLLEFSPSKEHILDQGAVEFLCGLTRRPHPGLRLNAVWALMNMAFQAEHRVKASILHHLGTDQIFRLLSDTDVHILMKTLGLLRNLLSTKAHIDQIMQSHGKEIMQAIILILEGEHSAEVKEQALCILANIADGDMAKSAIMSNEDVLKKLMNYMVIPNVKLQIAATFCISNLIWNVEEGAAERQIKLREMGVYKLLQNLMTTTDTGLFDKVKTALQQFL
ncbi:armadillo repeat-containing protein 8-like isoform X2 [Penaeus japonicus]|uniref:armadillo repeat-containing protein 8-like isoform X2 n=1 Tax=Penaeus japonicus TaxID=27405 RepID=UPI001C7169C6|nr:armadillo repeat-containing protein 8-like isoform X2 [Penaeus japonicus]